MDVTVHPHLPDGRGSPRPEPGVSTACIATPAAGRASLTAPEVVRWLLRNLAILTGAFLPALLLMHGIDGCVREPVEGCGAAIPFVVPLVWLWLALPMLVMGGVPVCLIVLIAWRWPRLARVLAFLFAFAFVFASAGLEWIRERPLDVPRVALGILYFGFMLRLDPRQRLSDAPWVWWVPVELSALAIILAIAGIA
jgi:hypothetical protein